MATYAAFLSTNYIKDNTPILDYVNSDELKTFIRPAQDQYIGRVLGTNLYDRLKNGIINSNLNSSEETLLREWIQPALMYWVMYEYILYSNYKLTNKALSKQDSDNSVPSALNEVNYLKSNIRDWAEYYTKQLTDYLKDNTDVFIEYLTGDLSWSKKAPKNDNYLFGGMYIPKDRWESTPERTPYSTFRLYW